MIVYPFTHQHLIGLFFKLRFVTSSRRNVSTVRTVAADTERTRVTYGVVYSVRLSGVRLPWLGEAKIFQTDPRWRHLPELARTDIRVVARSNAKPDNGIITTTDQQDDDRMQIGGNADNAITWASFFVFSVFIIV